MNRAVTASDTEPGATRSQAAWPLTIVIPVKNEARNLPGCLKSLPPGARVLVVDSDSTDATVEIARCAGAELINFKWPGGFPKKRNWVLQTYPITTEWVLFLDADEYLTIPFIDELREAISSMSFSGYWLRYTNYFMGKPLRFGVPQRKLALFRVGAGLYEKIDDDSWSALDMEIHEHPILNGAIGEIFAPIEHQDYRGLHHLIARHNEYSTWESRRYTDLIGDHSTSRELTFRQRTKYHLLTRWWFSPAYFIFTYFIRGGWLDGRTGFAYAAFKMIYFFEVRMKILENIRKASRRG